MRDRFTVCLFDGSTYRLAFAEYRRIGEGNAQRSAAAGPAHGRGSQLYAEEQEHGRQVIFPDPKPIPTR